MATPKRYPLGGLVGSQINQVAFERGQLAQIGAGFLAVLGLLSSEIVADSFRVRDISSDEGVIVVKVEWQTLTEQQLADGSFRKIDHSRVLLASDTESQPQLTKYGMQTSPEVAAYMDGDFLRAAQIATERANAASHGNLRH